MNRLQFYYKQVVGYGDLNALEDDIEGGDHNIVADILGDGFLISGVNPAAVTQNSTPNLKVLSNQLLAYDPQGLRLSNATSAYQGGSLLGSSPPYLVDCSVDYLGAPTAVVNPGNEKTLSIFVQFIRNPSDPQTDGNGDTVYYEQAESIVYNVFQSPEAAAGSSIPTPFQPNMLLLADIIIVHGTTQILNGGSIMTHTPGIDQERQQIFKLNLHHGATHLEFGTDPVPNATETDGGLLGHADKIVLDAVTDSGTHPGLSTGIVSGIGVLFPTQAALFQPANVTAPSGTTLDVTSTMSGYFGNGGPNEEGIVTTTPNNRCLLLNPNDDEFIDPNGRQVYGRLTTSAFFATIAPASNAVALPQTVINVGSTAGFPSSGTIYVQSSAGIQTINYTGTAGGNQFTGCTGGTGNLVTGNTVQSTLTPTWTLSFFIFNAMSDTETAFDMTPFSGTSISWWTQRCYYIHNLPTFAKAWSVPSDAAAGEVPMATTSVPGIVLLSGNGGVNAGVVQGNDSRLASLGAGNLPIGGIVAWLSATAGSPLPSAPSGFEYCDGGNVSTSGSPILGYAKPALMKTASAGTTLRVLRGVDGTTGTYGGSGNPLSTGGADTHSHTTLGHLHAASLGGGTSGGTTGGGPHTHDISPSSFTLTDIHGSPGSGVFNDSSPNGYPSTYTPVVQNDSPAHTHSIPAESVSVSGNTNNATDTTNTQPNIPAYVSAAFIIRVI